MRRFSTRGLALGLVGLLVGCPGNDDGSKTSAVKTNAASSKTAKSKTEPAKAPEKTTGPVTDHVNVGQRYTFETIIDNPSMTVKSVEVQTITHVTEDEILFDVETTSTTTMKTPVPGQLPIKPTVHKRKGNYPLKAPKTTTQPEKKSPEQTPVGKDTIEIDGVKFECDIYLNEGSRTCVDPRRFPGSVKSETKAMKRILTTIN